MKKKCRVSKTNICINYKNKLNLRRLLIKTNQLAGKTINQSLLFMLKKMKHTFLKFCAAIIAFAGLNVFSPDAYAQEKGQGENPVFRITKKYVPLDR